MGDKQDKDLWAVVITSAGLYLACIGASRKPTQEFLVNAMNEGDVVKFDKAFELKVQLLPAQTPEGIVMQRNISALPFINTFYYDTATYLSPVGAQFLDDMNSGDRDRYMKYVKEAEQMCHNARAAAAGITRATNIPSGQGRA